MKFSISKTLKGALILALLDLVLMWIWVKNEDLDGAGIVNANQRKQGRSVFYHIIDLLEQAAFKLDNVVRKITEQAQ